MGVRDGYDAVTAGAVEFEDGTVFDLRGAESLLFCLPGSVCTCEDGSSPAGQDIALLPTSRAVLTVASAQAATIGVDASYIRLEELCRRLVVQWAAPVSEILLANTAPYGGLSPGLRCDGTILLTFSEDGHFTRTWEATCTFLDASGAGSGITQGHYEDRGDTIIFVNAQTSGNLQVRGVDFGNFFDQTALGEATYLIQGDQLTLSFVAPDGAIIEHVYTRVQ